MHCAEPKTLKITIDKKTYTYTKNSWCFNSIHKSKTFWRDKLKKRPCIKNPRPRKVFNNQNWVKHILEPLKEK